MMAKLGRPAATLGLAALLHSTSAAALEPAGTATAVNAETLGYPPATPTRQIVLGADVFRGERVVTNADGTAQLLLLDNSTITIAADSEIVIDDYLYDPDTGTGSLSLQATRGILRFLGGKLSKRGTVTVRTPVSTLGIRGGIAIVEVDGRTGRTTALLGFGQLTVEAGGSLRRIVKPGFGAVIPGRGARPGPVTRLPASFVARAVTATESRPGQTGGAPRSSRQEITALSAAGGDLPASPLAPGAAMIGAGDLGDPRAIATEAQREGAQARTVTGVQPRATSPRIIPPPSDP